MGDAEAPGPFVTANRLALAARSHCRRGPWPFVTSDRSEVATQEQLGRERLNELTQHYALEVGDRRVLSHHIDALVRARSVDFAELLATLKREELQSICQALGLDTGGREKLALVQRILGGDDGSEQPAAHAPKPGPAAGGLRGGARAGAPGA